jgi:hypothetical protein
MTQAALLFAALLAQNAPPPPDAPAPRPAAPAAAVAEAMPSVKDVRAALDRGDGAEALRLVSRLLPIRGKAAQQYDRYELLSLKAEAHLRLKAGDAAAQSFKLAAEQTEEREKAAVARATEQLIRRSRGLAFTPRHAAKGQAAKLDPIDIVDPETRKSAMRAMFADDMAELAPKVRAAKLGTTLPPALKAMQAARELATLELAANGSADQVNGVVEELKQSCKDLLARAMERTTKRVDQITQMANDPEFVRQVFPNPLGGFEVEVAERRRGLKRQDISQLKALADTCDEVAVGGKAIAKAAGAEESEFEDLVEAAGDLRMHIRRMLRAHDVEY